MLRSTRTRIGCILFVATALAAGVPAVGASGDESPATSALEQQSKVLNCLYNSNFPEATCYPPARMMGFRITSETVRCLDVEPSAQDRRPDWLKALEVRSKALNCLYSVD